MQSMIPTVGLDNPSQSLLLKVSLASRLRRPLASETQREASYLIEAVWWCALGIVRLYSAVEHCILRLKSHLVTTRCYGKGGTAA